MIGSIKLISNGKFLRCAGYRKPVHTDHIISRCRIINAYLLNSIQAVPFSDGE